SFKDASRIYYQAEMEELDFVSATEESRKHINTWVFEKTDGEDMSVLLFAQYLNQSCYPSFPSQDQQMETGMAFFYE
ncbi:hypothetical protein FD755_025955, partial [Muntiacus reevesi]